MPSDKFALARERASPERASDVEASLPRNTRGGGSEPSTSRGSNPFRFVSFRSRQNHRLLVHPRSGSSIVPALLFISRDQLTYRRGSATRRDAPQPTGTRIVSWEIVPARNDLSLRSRLYAPSTGEITSTILPTRTPFGPPVNRHGTSGCNNRFRSERSLS